MDLAADDAMQQFSEAIGAAKMRVEGCSSFLKAAIKYDIMHFHFSLSKDCYMFKYKYNAYLLNLPTKSHHLYLNDFFLFGQVLTTYWCYVFQEYCVSDLFLQER